jgi:hypothetical protein
VGCGFIPTAAPGTPEACAAALLGPVTLRLADDGTSVVAHQAGVIPVALQWPAGFGLRPNGAGGGEVVDDRGTAVARIGDVVWLGGGMTGDDGRWGVCGPVMHEDPAQ